jgi:hypothetical protein
MTEIYTITPSIEQLTISKGIILPQEVTELTLPAAIGNTKKFNIIFDFGVTNETERSLAIDPPVTFTNASESSYFTLKLDTNITIPSAGSLYMYFWNIPDLGLITPTYEPNLEPLLSAEVFIETEIDNTSAAYVLQGDGTYSLIWNLDWDATYFKSDDSRIGLGEPVPFAFRDVCRNVLWNGRLGFTLANVAYGQIIFSGVSLSGPAIQFHTGRSGSRNTQGRAVHDMKTGLQAFAPEMQEDGFYEGIWTVAKAWDHKDPMEESPYEPPETEREREDDYPL